MTIPTFSQRRNISFFPRTRLQNNNCSLQSQNNKRKQGPEAEQIRDVNRKIKTIHVPFFCRKNSFKFFVKLLFIYV